MPEVSVIIPLYGVHRGRSVLPAVVRAWLAQDVSCEVLVAATGQIPAGLPRDLDAERTVRVLNDDDSLTTPGLLRNRAAAHARAPRLYLSDADVLPLGDDYVRRAIALAADDVFCQPWMHRLSGDIGHGERFGLARTPTYRFCFVRAVANGSLHPVGGERFRMRRPGGALPDNDVLAVLPPLSDLVAGVPEKQQWEVAFHWGALLLDRGLFADLGGYCRGYRGWGSEDDDLLVKVASRHHLTRAWRIDPTLACLHFEHPRQPVEKNQAIANRALYHERIAAGADAMVTEDLADQERCTTYGGATSMSISAMSRSI